MEIKVNRERQIFLQSIFRRVNIKIKTVLEDFQLNFLLIENLRGIFLTFDRRSIFLVFENCLLFREDEFVSEPSHTYIRKPLFQVQYICCLLISLYRVPSVQDISSTQKGHSFSAPKFRSSTPKTPQFHPLSFTPIPSVQNSFCLMGVLT